MSWPGAIVLLLVFLGTVGLVVLMVRGLVSMFRSDRSSGSRGAPVSGLTGAMLQIDRITRPSIEHVERVVDAVQDGDEIDGD